MDLFAIIEKFGIPVAVACAFGFFIWKQNQYIQNDLTKDLKEKFDRLEKIVIGLINAQKKHSIELRGLSSSYKSLVDIIKNLWNKK
tara:strand:- start:586 stop:843 length:258 start_codon:yes stop_codon:yes gene_type:complete